MPTDDGIYDYDGGEFILRVHRQRATSSSPRPETFFKRLAVTATQVYELGLPTRPTKQSDTRAHSFEGGWSRSTPSRPPSCARSSRTRSPVHIDAEALRLAGVAEQSGTRRSSGRMAGEAMS